MQHLSPLTSCRAHLSAAALFSALLNILYIVPTIYMLQVYDRVVPTQGRQTLFYLTLLLLLGLAALSLLDRVRSRLLVKAGLSIDAALALPLLHAATDRPDLPHARNALRDLDLVRATLSGPAVIALFDAPWTPIYLIVCFLVHPAIGALAAAGMLILPAIATGAALMSRRLLALANSKAMASYEAQETLLANAETIHAMGMRGFLVSRLAEARLEMLEAQTRTSFRTSGYLTFGKFLRLSLQSLALGLGVLLAIDDAISVGAIFASSFLIARALSPVEQLIAHGGTLGKMRRALRNIDTLLAKNRTAAAFTTLPAPRGEITLEKLTLLRSGSTKPVLDGISIEIEAGQVVAIMGPSGAGKSTLVRAMVGALQADDGAVRVDGADRRDWDPERLARHIGYVPQSATLLPGTIAENIARFELAGRHADQIDAAIIKAAKDAGAHDLILALDGGYNHSLGRGGSGLSAGQAQRIALARALYGDPAIVIMDEPNAHLDRDGDRLLTSILSSLKEAGKTVLIVSHKLDILPVVDRVLVLRAGRVAAFGDRDDIFPRPKLDVLASRQPNNFRQQSQRVAR